MPPEREPITHFGQTRRHSERAAVFFSSSRDRSKRPRLSSRVSSPLRARGAVFGFPARTGLVARLSSPPSFKIARLETFRARVRANAECVVALKTRLRRRDGYRK